MSLGNTSDGEENTPWTVELIPNVYLNFTRIPEGRKLLTTPDDYLNEMVEFDYKVRLKTNETPDPNKYLTLLAKSVREWEDEEMVVITREYQKHRLRLMRLNLNWPQYIHLVKTDGSDESNAAYCRSNNIIVLSQTHVDRAVVGESDPSTLWHELWHIISRNNLTKREQLFKSLGFRYMHQFDIPEFLTNHRITNPDAPKFDVVITVDTEGDGPISAAPVCYYNKDEVSDDSFFPYYVAELLAVEEYQPDSWRARTDNDGEIILFSARECESFWEQVGENTNYINHPEEILAENFVLWIDPTQRNDESEIPSPWVIEKMNDVMMAA